MSQFSPRFQSTPPKAPMRESEVRLRTSPEAYAQENSDSAFARHHQETQKIKNLSFWENIDQEASEEDEWAERQSPTPFILVMIILVVASTLLWFLFRWVSSDNSNTPPIIPADTAPFKVRPENPGGMMIPHQDKLVYDRLSQHPSKPIERLLPSPEQPMPEQPMTAPPMPAAPMAAPSMGPSSSHQQPYPPEQGYNNPSMQGTQFQPQHQQPGALQPQREAYQPYQSQTPYGPPPPMPAAELPPTHQIPLKAAMNPMPPKQLSAVEGIKPAQDEDDESDAITQEGHNELDQLIAKEAKTPLKRVPKKNTGKYTKPMAMDSGKHKVQIASLPSQTMAEQEMKRLHTHYVSVFENKPWNIQKINLGPDRGFTYRLVVGSFPNRNAAMKFCKKLRAEKIGCLVVAPANE